MYHNKESAKLVNHKTKCSQTFNLSAFLLMTKKIRRNAFMMQCCDWFWLLNSILSFWHHLSNASRIWYKSSIFYGTNSSLSFQSFPQHALISSIFLTVNFNYFLLSKKSSVKPFIFPLNKKPELLAPKFQIFPLRYEWKNVWV